MPEADDLALLVAAARAAGEIAMTHFRRAPQVWDKPGGAGPVTAADLAVDEMLRERLGAARPAAGWLSEETADTPDRLARQTCLIVDPIDGTRAFIAGETTWAHSLALAEEGEVTAAVVYLPAQDLLYTARRGGAVELNGAAIRVSGSSAPEGATVLTAARNMHPAHWPGGVPPVERKFRPSLAWRLALVAEGRFDAMLTLTPTWEWDVAAGTLIADRAGARVTDRTGAAPRFNGPTAQIAGLVAAAPALHLNLIERLAPQARAERTDRV